MPFEIFVLPGLLCFAYGFYRSLKHYNEEFSKENEVK